MATRTCPYCEAVNPADDKYCQTCGIPQAPEGTETAAPVPPPPQRKQKSLQGLLENTNVRYGAIALAVIFGLGVAFLLGRLSGGSDDPAATTLAASETTTTTATTEPPDTTTTTTTSTTTTTTIPIGFDDVGDNTENAAEINALTALGVRVGCNPPANTLFCPNDPMTRGQMASLLVGAMGYEDAGSENLFSDDDGTAFEEDIQRVAVASITKGCNPPENTLFCPDQLVTRGQIAVFLVRAFDLKATTQDDLFSDDDGSVYEPSIQILATAGVLQGCNPPNSDEVCPGDSITRGEMAALLLRALENQQ